MFCINTDKSIYITRGDTAVISLGATAGDQDYIFKVDDVVRFVVCERNQYDKVVLCKEVKVSEEKASVDIVLTGDETKIGDTISKPKDYWYEIELNPDTAPQTIVGHDVAGPKIFRLFPEGVIE